MQGILWKVEKQENGTLNEIPNSTTDGDDGRALGGTSTQELSIERKTAKKLTSEEVRDLT